MNRFPELQIGIVASDAVVGELRQELLALCSRAYQEDFSAYFALLSPAVHVLARVEGRIVCHAAWIERELRVQDLGRMRTAYVEAVATLPEHQGKGYASFVLAQIPALVSDFDLAALSPSADAFYRRLGWESWRGPLSYRSTAGDEVSTPEDRIMIHRLPRTPVTLDLNAGVSVDWRPIEVW